MEVVLLGETSREYMEKQTKIVATAAKLSRYNGNVLEIYNKLTEDFEENVKFIERVIKMGHDSITDHDYLVFALKDVSAIVEQTIIEQRYCSFTIKSRREVNFSNVGYYMPNFHDKENHILENNQDLQINYQEQMNYLFQEYSKLVEMNVPFEDARYILPMSLNSNIVMGVDAHALKDLIIDLTKGKHSNITELKELGSKLYDALTERASYIKPLINREKRENKDVVEEYLRKIIVTQEQTKFDETIDYPILLSSTKNIDETLFVSAIMRVYGYSYEQSLDLYHTYLEGEDKQSQEIKNKLIRLIHISEEELKNINFSFQIPISLANLTHLTRHRTHEMLIPDFVPIRDLLRYQTPVTISQSGYDIEALIRKNCSLYHTFKNSGVREEDLVYFYLMGNMMNVVTNMNGKTLKHILRLRCCNKAQWEIRSIANEIRNIVVDNSTYFSQILGPTCEVDGICYEGKESCGKIKRTLKK